MNSKEQAAAFEKLSRLKVGALFMPARRMDEHIKTDRAPYDLWRHDGLITVTETMGGIKTDYKYILTCLFDIVKEFDIRIECIAYDPHNTSSRPRGL